MCLLIVLREVVPDWPLVVAANRDERYDRPSEPPRLLTEDPPVFGGRDLRAGGTWLAVNHRGMLCAVANRPQGNPNARGLRSRGLLCLDAAAQPSPIAAADLVSHAIAHQSYTGFNLICGTAAGATALYYNGRLREKPLGRGAFVFTTGDANDVSLPKVERALDLLGADQPHSLPDWVKHLEGICRDHDDGSSGPGTLCMHGDQGGTVSSAIVALHRSDPRGYLFRYCPGRPCEKAYTTLEWPRNFFTAVSLVAASS